MCKIRMEINPITNYVYHMLSVAGVGYDNDYGRRWRHTVPESDRAVLQAHERQLTVKGGEHCGEWYGPLVCGAARGEALPGEYYARMDDPAMAEVCRVMAKHYPSYLTDVYPDTLRELQPYADELQRLLEKSDFPRRAETLVGGSLQQFRVMLVNAVAGGAEAIDISPDQDVFGIGRTPGEELLFIGHEYIIYLLKQVLEGTAAFCTMETWRLTEGLAEYYMREIFGNNDYFRQFDDEIAFYRSLPRGLDTREMFLRASAWELLRMISREYETILGGNLVGVYAHGSMAFGCFAWEQSDIDFLVVAQTEPDDGQKQRMLDILLQLDPFAPKKGFEMSVVLAEDCAAPAHPIPFCLHYSNAHRAASREDLAAHAARMRGEDPDLAAHFTVIRAVGKTIAGRPLEDVFAPVPQEMYLDSILGDVENARQDVTEEPVYVILNLCRVLAAVRHGLVLSKQQGGAWALEHLPQEMHAQVAQALRAYEQGGAAPENGEYLAAKMLEMIREEMQCSR